MHPSAHRKVLSAAWRRWTTRLNPDLIRQERYLRPLQLKMTSYGPSATWNFAMHLAIN